MAKHDLIFFSKRSTPKVVPQGAKFDAPEGYGTQTKRRAATAAEEKTIASGAWLRVDQAGKKGGSDGYKKSKLRPALVREKSAVTQAHGFVFPGGMPPCAECGLPANDDVHVNPARRVDPLLLMAMPGGIRTVSSLQDTAGRRMTSPRRSHAYASRYETFARVPCVACGQQMTSGLHSAGLAVGSNLMATGSGSSPQMAAQDGTLTPTFVTQIADRVLLTAPASVLENPDTLPRELAAEWERASASNKSFQWVDGRFVEADRANRNKAFWSTADLEIGAPSVAHGPLNWLHDERHVIGAIAAAELVRPTDDQVRVAAAEGHEAPNTHIRALSTVWSFLHPREAAAIRTASDGQKLWYSMECVSREVACLEPDCGHVQTYGDYMGNKGARCPHVIAGGPRQFRDPTFLGGAVIVPPVRPGWAGASASVLRQAAALAEEQEDSLVGLTEEEAVAMVAQLINYSGGKS